MKLQKGSILSHYKLLEEVGAGGMAVVYKAQDLKLDRLVALKFLPRQVGIKEEEKERFIQEAKTASALDHPNICTIYEIDETPEGQLFISMGYYEGETLRSMIDKGPLSLKEALDITQQICEGMAKAHENGIIHRDIKPANIILTKDSIAKIVDFGVAKIQFQRGTTVPGSIIGTPGYMSPEQARGKEADHRADIWAIGIILFEMLAARLPFEGNSDLSLMYAIVNEDPLKLNQYRKNVPERLEQIFEKILAKSPDERYQKMSDVLDDIKTLDDKNVYYEKTIVSTTLSPPQAGPSIAVLPFVDLSAGKNQEYFCDGLAEEIINALTQVEDLQVVSRNSAFQFKGMDLDVSQIGQKLKVQSILEGSIRKGGKKIRIAIRLINVANGYLLWAENYERQLGDVFATQDEIARSVVDALSLKLIDLPEKAPEKKRTSSIEAYNTYLKGRFEWHKRTAESIEKSIEYFNKAVQRDAQYALAYAGLADSYIVLGFYGKLPPGEAMPKALQASKQALALDEQLAEAYISLGCAKAVYEWSWLEAEENFKRGITLKPNYPIAHHWFAINYLTPLGRFDEAVEETIQALELDPVSLVIGTTVGLVYYFAREYDTAIRYFNKALSLDPEFAITNFFLGRALVQKSMHKKGIEYIQKALKIYGDSTNMLATFGNAAATAQRADIAEKVLTQLLEIKQHMYVSSYDIASIYCGLNDIEEAINWLEKAYEERSYLLIYLKVDPAMDALRGAQRFKDVEQKIFGDI